MRTASAPLERLGIEIGHHTDTRAETGMTAFLMRKGASIGVDILGGNTGTFNTPAFSPGSLLKDAHGVVLTGGSTYG